MKLDTSNETASQNYAIMRLYSALEEVRALLNASILPLAGHLGLDKEDPELTQTLDLAASAINQHLNNYRLQATRVR